MLIQTPGSFVWAGSLAARLGSEGWSTWGIFVVTGCLQGCLLVMGISFEVKARRARQEVEGDQVSSRQFSDMIVTNYTQTSGRFFPDGSTNAETDDEGGANVENGLNERTPLITGSRKSSYVPA